VSLSDASGDNSTPSVIQPNNGIPTPSGQAPFAQPSSLASELTDPEVTITLSTSSNNRDRWSAYVSYHPVKSGLFWHRTVHAGTCDAVTSKAEEFAARWKAEANVTQLIDGDAPEDAPPKKRNRKKYAENIPAPRAKRGCSATTYDETSRRSGDYKAGAGRGNVSAGSSKVKPISALPLASQVWQLNIQLSHLRKLFNESQQQLQHSQSKWGRIEALLASHQNDTKESEEQNHTQPNRIESLR
jgi:hypothetical protein